MDGETINWWNIVLGHEETEAVTNAIDNRCISMGRITEDLEESLAVKLGVPHVVCVTSGTSALMVACMAAGIRAGDEVIVPDRTFVATAHAPMILGAGVRLIDTKQAKPVIDELLIEEKITGRTKAIIPVHLNGHAADIDAINTIASRHGLVVIEDACQALLSKTTKGYMGTLSRFGCFSLGMAKLITSGQGGFITCQTYEDCQRLKKIRSQGVLDVFREKNYDFIAGNFKYTDVQAAIARTQLNKIDAKKAHQINIYTRYHEALAEVQCLKSLNVDVLSGEVPLRPEYVCTARDRFIEAMNDQGITVVAHTHSLNMLPYLHSTEPFPRSTFFHSNSLMLPCGPDQPMQNIETTIAAIKRIAGQFPAWTS